MKRKKIIIVIIILLLLLLVLLIAINKKNKTDLVPDESEVSAYKAYNENRANEGISAKDARAHVEDNINEYYTIKGIIERLNQNILYLNGTAKDLDLIVTAQNEAKILEEYRQKGIKYITDILAPNYKDNYSVNDEYIKKTLSQYSGKKYQIDDLYVVDDSEYINTYFVYGKYGNTNYNFIIIMDRYNSTFEIYLNNYFVENNYSKDDTSTMRTLNISSVERNDNNSFQNKNIEREQIARIYYEEYIDLMKNDIDRAYSLLDGTYREKRFGSIEKFTEYVKSSKAIENPHLRSYTITSMDGYTEYVCQDELGFNFVFKVTGAMKYTAMLDAYTVSVGAYQKEYAEADNNKKVELCFNRFFECLNNKDYDSAYAYLNKTYREKQFPTVESFKEYIISTWFNVNQFGYKSVSADDSGTYTVYGTIKDYESVGSYDAGRINKTFYVKPGSNYNQFEVSFTK